MSTDRHEAGRGRVTTRPSARDCDTCRPRVNLLPSLDTLHAHHRAPTAAPRAHPRPPAVAVSSHGPPLRRAAPRRARPRARLPPRPRARRQGPSDHAQGLLRCRARRQAPRARRHGPLRQDGAQDGRELPCAHDGRQGGRRGARLWLRGVKLPPHHQELHDPGRRLHLGRRPWRQVDLRRQVRGRELQAQAHWSRHAFHGQRRARHERLAVLHLHRQDDVARRQARRLWPRHRGHGRCLRHGERQDGARRQAGRGRDDCKVWRDPDRARDRRRGQPGTLPHRALSSPHPCPS